MRIDRSRNEHRYRNEEKILILSCFRNLEIPMSLSMYSRLSSWPCENVTIRSALWLQGDPSYRYRLRYSCRFVLSTQSFSPRPLSSSRAYQSWYCYRLRDSRENLHPLYPPISRNAHGVRSRSTWRRSIRDFIYIKYYRPSTILYCYLADSQLNSILN